MTEETKFDFEGSYLLGEADGDMWIVDAHPNEAQSLAMLGPDDIGQRDMFGHRSADWLMERAESYSQQDERFDSYSYYEGFLSSVRRARQARAFAAVGSRSTW